VLSEEDRAMATGNMHKKLGKFRCVVSKLSKWSDREIYRLQ